MSELRKYISLTLSIDGEISNLDRKAYINNLYPAPATYNNEKRNSGIIQKFNSAIGFKNTVDNFDNYNCSTSKTVENPNGFQAPSQILFNSLRVSFKENEVCIFTVENKRINHTKSNYAYKTEDMIYKFAKFIEKVYPSVMCKVSYSSEKVKYTVKEFVLNHFFIGISDSPYYTIEVSVPELLDNEDKEEIISIISDITPLRVAIEQYYCDVCREHSDGENSYHTEIVYLD